MDFVQGFLDLARQVIWVFIDGLAALLQEISGSMGTLSDYEAQVCAGVILVGVFGAWFVRKVNWLKLKIFQTQTITLRTEKTPWQVMADDMRGCFFSLFLILVLAIVFYALLAGP